MTRRGVRKYVDDLLAGRRPGSFPADDFDAAQIRTAIELRAAEPGADEPRPEFVNGLKSRIAQQFSPEGPEDAAPTHQRMSATRRQVIVGSAAAATAAVAAVSIEHLVTGRGVPAGTEQAGAELVPNEGAWLAVAKSADLAEGSVLPFELPTVTGFVRRAAGGNVEAVSGVCTHQGCKLWFDDSADSLRCPCHVTSFSPAGEVLTHQLPIAPKPLPHFEVRERAGNIEVLAPRPPARPA
ncbi:Rieske 2Fe-2S domain-containing protein [Mycobacterium sp. 20091114027_K0903767]|nr:Rieske 2Fe-2S domain-containing protein [Mycobacterium sp. 20091114027_K0903767]OCB47431.1 (2Fe-2S)-binding protein [Mycolicibacterium vulneris]